MNGPEHYKEAERLLADMPTVRQWFESPEHAADHAKHVTAAAQVHATLALAAATALAIDATASTVNGHDDWIEATQ